MPAEKQSEQLLFMDGDFGPLLGDLDRQAVFASNAASLASNTAFLLSFVFRILFDFRSFNIWLSSEILTLINTPYLT